MKRIKSETVEVTIEPVDIIGNWATTGKRNASKNRIKDGQNTASSQAKLMEKHLANIQEIISSSNATLIRSCEDVGYVCYFCFEQFPLPKDLKQHNREQHIDLTTTQIINDIGLKRFYAKLDITDLKCTICNISIDSLEVLIDHLVKDHKRKIDVAVKNQIFPFKFDSEGLRCCVCSVQFGTFKPLLQHMNVHYRNYICNICDAGFINRAKLHSHRYTHKIGVFQCSFCPKVFETKMKRSCHERGVHTKVNQRARCGFCSKFFKTNKLKAEHMKEVHNAKPVAVIKCQACEKEFTSQEGLRIHTKRDHLMERKYACAECDMRFFTAELLRNHKIKHSGVRQYQCHVCLKAYARVKTLKEHMRIHADDRRFKCEHCGQAFVQKCSWRGHMRSKHGEAV